MNERKLRESLANLERAVTRLEEALQADDSNALAVDGTIQRFEFALELLWKTLKRALAFEGVSDVGSPRAALKAAFAAGWLEDEELWLGMLADRNRTSHVYDERMARNIYDNIRRYAPAMRKALDGLKARFGGI